jgi:tRNA(Ile)-lysidine synthetase-like protein
LAVLQDETRRTGTSHGQITDSNDDRGDGTKIDPNRLQEPNNIHHDPSNNYDHSSSNNDQETSPLLSQQQQQQQQQFTEDDILECGYFLPAHPSTAPIHHIVYTTIQRFLDQYVMKFKQNVLKLSTFDNTTPVSSSLSSSSSSPLVPSDHNAFLQPPQPQPQPHRNYIIISLSGGVDSMVICAVLAHLQQYNTQYQNLQIIAIHIDYANRPESYQESKFVQHYCQDVLGNVSYHCRRIDEVTRGITARDQYERIARDIRYQFYRDIIELYYSSTNDVNPNGIESSSNSHNIGKRRPTTVTDTIGVMLGHHRGDLRENVLSNAHKGCGPLDLSGMTAISHNDGVILLRPLLPLEKSFIFDYAHKFGIPYFKDTTPHWSTRGKLRNKLLPLLEEIYGEGSMNNLSNLAVESDECRALLHNVMIQPFLDSITYQPMGISFPTSSWIHQGLYFWKIVLREALHSAGLGMFSDKSVESFVKRVCCTNIHEGWLQCRKDYGVYLRTDGCIFVLYPASFPWGNPPSVKSVIDSWTLPYTHVDCTDENTIVHVGPWTVTTRRYKFTRQDANEKLEQSAFKTMEEFMEGEFEYWLEIPPHVGIVQSGNNLNDNLQSLNISDRTQLIFTTFVKSTRPKAWKGIDPKIQDALPLLGYVTISEKRNQTDYTTPGSDEEHIIRNGIEVSERHYARIRLCLTTREACACTEKVTREEMKFGVHQNFF